jgi:uncharacterized coiled-coil protein SlyX
MSNIFPFGYKDYNDVIHNGVLYTQSELQNVKIGDNVIVLTMTDSDDDYSLENRLFEFTVDSVTSDGFNAGGFWVDLPNFSFEYFLILHPKDYVFGSETPEKTKKIGEFTPKDKFIEFIGGKGHINFIASEATIEGKYLSGLDLEDVIFKLTICDDGTVDLEEMGDTNKTTKEQRSRLVDIISDKTVKPYRQRIVVSELPFKSIQTIKDKTVPLFLSVEYQKPIEKLGSLFDDDDTTIEPVEVTDEQSSKLDMLMSLFDDDDTSQEQMEVITSETITEVVDIKKDMEDAFAKMKREKIAELNNRLEDKEKEIDKFNREISTTQKRVEKAQEEAKLLQDRIESLYPELQFNGYYFNVSERLNEKITLEPHIAEIIKEKISKVKSINSEKFMQLFEDGEYRIRLGKKSDDGQIEEFTDYESLPEDVKKSLRKIGTQLEIEDKDEAAKKIQEASDSGNATTVKLNYKLIYVGGMTWGDIVNKMIKAGFGQDSEFDKMSGSNSYKIYDTEEPSNPAELKHLNTFENFDNHGLTVEDLEDVSEELGEFEDSNGYEMGDKFLFSIYEDLTATNELGDPQIVFSVSPKSYFDKEGCCYDQHLEWVLKAKFPILKQMGDSFEELEEGSFDFADESNDCHLSVEETVDILCKAGLIPSIGYQNWCSQKDTQLFMDTIEKLGHKNLLIP